MGIFGMGNCTKSKLAKNPVAISIIGLDDAGKTTAVKVLKGDGDIKEMSPTVGFEPHEFQYNGIDLVLNDLGGGVRVRDLWKHYLAESYGFIFVIDSSNRSRVYETSKVFSNFVENEKVGNKPVLIIANKQEMPNSMDESEIVQYLNVEELVNKFQIPCRIESSTANSGTGAKIDEALKTGFDWLIKYILHKQEELKIRIDYDVGLQRGRESRIKSEKFDKIKERREAENSDDLDDYEKSNVNPWKSLNDLKGSSKSKMTASSSESKLSAYDKQLLEDMRGNTPNGRLTTIDEERSKLRNQNRFMKNNKLAPFDDRSERELPTKSSDKSRSWAIVDSKKGLPALDSRPSRRFEI